MTLQCDEQVCDEPNELGFEVSRWQNNDSGSNEGVTIQDPK